MRYLVELAYDGTHYSGWQRQEEPIVTIQQTIEDCLTKLWKQKIVIVGCGRTDAGVHASQYFFHVDFDGSISYDLKKRLNQMLPLDIRILNLAASSKQFHAQYDAKKRSYEYHFHTIPNPFKRNTSVFLSKDDIDPILMQEAIDFIGAQTDFKSMCKKPDQYENTNCTIFYLGFRELANSLVFTITANRFLQSMVRLLIARIMEVASGKMQLEELKECFISGNPPKFPVKAFPQGLYLSKVEYDN